MFFELFLNGYKNKIFKNILFSEIPFKEIPLYRKILFICFLIAMIVLIPIYGFLSNIYFCAILIVFIIFVIITKIFDSTKDNKAKWEKIKKNVLKRNILILNELLEEYNIKDEKQINYITEEAKKYKTKYSLKEIFKIPIIFPTIFILFFLPKIQIMINKEIPDKLFLLILLLYIIILAWIYTMYNLFTIFFIPKYEVCNKLIEDLNFISTFKNFEYK
ncbi:MAG: hypothetical protein SPJ84_07985 [Fusobacterium gastrosuis]|uniref:hypothetical protein n=1 Tax=Fusobacterium gastrosuis TaxID=1755100 RepID=UPI002A9D97BD|nr:hypothetical protein [Fusobacterium gastrosuis]